MENQAVEAAALAGSIPSDLSLWALMLRAEFVAGDAQILQRFLLYRTYHGCAMPLQHQWASISAWSDEQHVRENRELYRQKFDAVTNILDNCLPLTRPPASFYLWTPTPIADTEFARGLREQENVVVLPGQFLGRDNNGHNPGANYVRMALVASLDQCIEAAQRIRRFCDKL